MRNEKMRDSLEKRYRWESRKMIINFWIVNLAIITFVIFLMFGLSKLIKAELETYCPDGIAYCVGVSLYEIKDDFNKGVEDANRRRSAKFVTDEAGDIKAGSKEELGDGEDSKRK